LTEKLLGQRLAARFPVLDGIADAIQPRLQRALSTSLPLRNLLDGTWLRSPLHPALTDVPIGAATTAFALDLAAVAGRSKPFAQAADRVLAIAVLATLPAAATGAADWRDLKDEQRRVASVHAVVNSAALALNIGSLALRGRGSRSLGRLLSTGALLVTSVAAHIGGELSFGLGVRVNRTAFEKPPTKFTAVGDVPADSGLHRAELDGAPVLLARSADGAICAIAATCSHLGGPLDEGSREGDTVVCPWHKSRFDLCTGEVIDGPAVFPQPTYETRVRAGKLELRAR
jgi:nitrite reductase/ring-hydroxylating ferredoxin subunit/uncharacterized membrane protein